MPYHLQQHYRELARLRQAQADSRHLYRWLAIYALGILAVILAAIW